MKQDPEDEPAENLLERIEDKRVTLVKEKSISNFVTEEYKDVSTEIGRLPKSWGWSFLGFLISVMDSGWSPKCLDTPSQSENTWGILKTTSVQKMKFVEIQNKELPENLKPRPKHEVHEGDLLITRAGPKNRVGVSCVVPKVRPLLMISDKIIRFHLLSKGLLPEYVILTLNAGVSKEYLESQMSGMADSQVNISQSKLRLTPIPIAPTKEQKRIVDKVDQLMRLCDQLERDLDNRELNAVGMATSMTSAVLASCYS